MAKTAKTAKTTTPAKKAAKKATKAARPKASAAPAPAAAAAPPASFAREQLPIPDPKHVGLTTYDAKDPNTKYPPIKELRPPKEAPNVLIVLIDDAGFGASSAFGGPCNTPVAERLAGNGLKLNRFHTTALCSPTRQAMLTGRNHHSVGMGAITEMATSAPGNNSIRPKEKAPIAETLKLNGYSTAQFGKCHEVPGWEVTPVGPFHQLTFHRPRRGAAPYSCSRENSMVDTATVVVTLLLAALFTFSASIKLLGAAKSLEIRDHLGVSPSQWRLIGALELAGVAGVLVGLLWSPIGIAAAIGLTLLSIGAVAFHLRASDRIAEMLPAAIGVALAVATAVLHTL